MATSMIIKIPEDIGKLADVLMLYPGESNDIKIAQDLDALTATLHAHRGDVVSIDFPDEPDPMQAVYDVAESLDKSGGLYWGHFDGFTERSRGIRTLGQVVVNIAGARVANNIPWEYGEPDFDKGTLLAAGFPEDVAVAIDNSFYPPRVPSPK